MQRGANPCWLNKLSSVTSTTRNLCWERNSACAAPTPSKLKIHSLRNLYGTSASQSSLEGAARDSQQQDLAVVAALLAARADVHLKNTYGRTALHYAAMEGNFMACYALIDAGALPDEVDKHGCTPVQHALLMKRADWHSCHDLLSQVMMNKPSDEELAEMGKKKTGKKGKKGKKNK